MASFFHDPAFILLASLAIVIGSIVFLRIGAFFSLLFGALAVSFWNAIFRVDPASAAPIDLISCVTSVGGAMGKTVGNIGLLIVFGATIGKCMTDSGAADRIVLAFRRAFGEKRGPAALAGGAFVLSIPIFYDATFYLLLPLAKSMYRAARKNYVLYLLAVGLAATISHTVIPPTPGPVAVADSLGVSLGAALGVGLLVGAFLCPFALILAWALNKTLPQPKLSKEVVDELKLDQGNDERTNDEASDNSIERLPPLALALAPIAVPALLIASAAASAFLVSEEVAKGAPMRTLAFLGSPNVALAISTALAAVTALFYGDAKRSRSELEKKLNAAIVSAGAIILITAAGGSYGEMLRGSGIGDRIVGIFGGMEVMSGVAILSLAFAVTALLKSAQGSSTTAMITSASIFASMNLTSDILGCNLAYLVATIGVGSAVASWMNDSGFCVFSRTSGISEIDSLKVWTVGTAALGCVGFVIILVLSRIIPLT